MSGEGILTLISTYAIQGLAGTKKGIDDAVNALNGVCKEADDCLTLRMNCRDGLGGLIPSNILNPLQSAYQSYVEGINEALPLLATYLSEWESSWHSFIPQFSKSCSVDKMTALFQAFASEATQYSSYYAKYQANQIIDKIKDISTFCGAHQEIVSDLQLVFNKSTHQWAYSNMKYSPKTEIWAVFSMFIRCQGI